MAIFAHFSAKLTRLSFAKSPALILAAALSLIPLFFSCKTAPSARAPEKKDIPMEIMGGGKMSAEALARFFIKENPSVSRIELSRLISIYIEECALEGVNSDVAFAQMCLETGFLRFGGLVSREMNNFCGLGAIGPEEPGISFPDERTGIRAHVQHLKGYGTEESLNGELVDPRYKWISPKGKAASIFALAGTWAADPDYGFKLFALLERMYESL